MHAPRGSPKTNGAAATTPLDAAFGPSPLSLLGGEREARHASFLPIAHTLPLPVYVTDPEGYVVYHNAAAAALWGHSPAPREVRWCGSERLFTREGAPLAHEESPMARALDAGGDAEPVELLAERRDVTLCRAWHDRTDVRPRPARCADLSPAERSE